MTKTSHRDCTHPSTKAARTKCRKERAADEARHAKELTDVMEGYRDESLTLEEVGMRLANLSPEAYQAFYIDHLDIEEIIAIAHGE